ncbi:MAG: protoporphyrinogen oxidase [Candidatus Hydrogenedentes bacterium]|nr:protoporphyrinogen oxidase [Candidatus Hydrogenedentota bacterium]
MIGGGISGLCTAFYLAKEYGRDAVTVLEADTRLGGTARTDTADGFTTEWGPNGFLDKEPLTLQWADDLGLHDRLSRANENAARRFIYAHGRLNELKGPPAFLFSPLMSAAGRLRLLCEPFIPQRTSPEPESIWNFAARRIGREAADVMVASMVSGVYAGDAKQLSLQHCFPRMYQLERDHGGLYRALRAIKKQDPTASPMGPKGTLTTFIGGMGELIETAGQALGDRVRLGASVKRVTPADGGHTVELDGGESMQTEHVIFAAPAFAVAGMIEAAEAQTAARLRSVPYASISVVCLAFERSQVKHDLNGFGFLIPRTEGLRGLGCLWTSSLFNHRASDGKVLLRIMYGGATDPGIQDLDDDALTALVAKEIYPILGISGAPTMCRIYRHGRGIPQYSLQHQQVLDAVDALEARQPGLHFAGNAYRGVSLNDCVVSARRVLGRIKAATG